MNTTRLLTILTLFLGCGPQQQEAKQVETQPVETEQATDPTIVPVDDDQPELPSNQLLKVIKIIDGDTIDVLTDDKETIRLRLNGIDTPENGQPFGKNAKQFLSQTIGGKSVRIVKHDVDRYGRAIADIYLPVSDPLVNLPDMFLNRELVKRGLAWHCKQYSDDERLAQDEEWARAGKLGSGVTQGTSHRGTGGSCQRQNGTNSDELSARGLDEVLDIPEI